MTTPGYIYVENWDRFQHYGDRKPVWIKTYLDLLENEDYLNLTAADRALLEGLWKLVGVCGNGRVQANPSHLRARLRLRKCELEPLIHAGWITVRASKALANGYQVASPEKEVEEEKEKEPPFKYSPQKPRGSKKRREQVATVRRIYNQSIKDGETVRNTVEWLLTEYRHDKSIVLEAIPEARQTA